MTVRYPENPVAFYAELQRQALEELRRIGGEVRMVARMETNAQRTIYLEGVREHRGRDEALKLREAVYEYMKRHGLLDRQPQAELFDG